MAVFTFKNPTGTIIQDLTTVTQTIAVNGPTGTITDVSITLTNLSHMKVDDLDMLLVAPDGTSNLEFWSDAAVGDSVSNYNITVSDTAAAALPGGNPLVHNAAYKPADYLTVEADTHFGSSTGGINHPPSSGSASFGSAFAGGAANGNWTLYLRDDAAGGTGGLQSWSVTITTTNSFATIVGAAADDTLAVMSTGTLTGLYSFNGGPEVLYSGLAIVAFDGGEGDDTLLGGSESDTASGGNGNDLLIGGGNNDILNGGLGTDTLRGGAGNDTYVVEDSVDLVDESVAGSGGIDTVNSSISFSLTNSATLLGAIENLSLLGTANINGIGNQLANELTGNNGNNVLNGLGGADIMRGRGGSDTYLVENANDIADETLVGSGGIDAVVSSTISINLADAVHFKGDIENVTLIGSAAINATGNALANVLTGNAAANVLRGGAGADVLIGGAGNDIYALEDGADAVTDTGGIDAITSTISRNLANYTAIENLVLVNVAAAVNAVGNNLNNSLSGNAFNNAIAGVTGNDVLNGGLGNDQLAGGVGNDVFIFNTALSSATNLDTLADFGNTASNDDSFRLDNAVFASLGAPGVLNAAFFRAAAQPLDGNDYIIYNQATGALLYDSDGNGVGAGALQFATLSNKPTLTAGDFVVT